MEYQSSGIKKILLASSAFLLFLLGILYFSKEDLHKPRVSIITSVWKGDLFIEGFLENITQQTIFPEAELIIINANSPGNEEPIIKNYIEKYPNIIYVKLDQDPGLYAVWNQAIKIASTDYITNANVDDRSLPDAIERHLKELENDPSVDLIYAGYIITNEPNDTFERKNQLLHCEPHEFSLQNMRFCLPGPRPVWRKSIHEKWGYFDETFTSSGDMEMWLRAVSHGSQFKKISGYPTLFYHNPNGISTTKDEARSKQRLQEDLSLFIKYSYMWNLNKTEE